MERNKERKVELCPGFGKGPCLLYYVKNSSSITLPNFPKEFIPPKGKVFKDWISKDSGHHYDPGKVYNPYRDTTTFIIATYTPKDGKEDYPKNLFRTDSKIVNLVPGSGNGPIMIYNLDDNKFILPYYPSQFTPPKFQKFDCWMTAESGNLYRPEYHYHANRNITTMIATYIPKLWGNVDLNQVELVQQSSKENKEDQIKFKVQNNEMVDLSLPYFKPPKDKIFGQWISVYSNNAGKYPLGFTYQPHRPYVNSRFDNPAGTLMVVEWINSNPNHEVELMLTNASDQPGQVGRGGIINKVKIHEGVILPNPNSNQFKTAKGKSLTAPNFPCPAGKVFKAWLSVETGRSSGNRHEYKEGYVYFPYREKTILTAVYVDPIKKVDNAGKILFGQTLQKIEENDKELNDKFNAIISYKNRNFQKIARNDFDGFKIKYGVYRESAHSLIYQHYVGNKGAAILNGKLRNGEKLKTDGDEKFYFDTFKALRYTIFQNTLEVGFILQRFVDQNFLNNFGFPTLNDKDENSVKEAVHFAKKHLVFKKNFTELGFISCSYGEKNVFIGRPVRLELYLPRGTHLFCTHNDGESEVILKNGMIFLFIGAYYEKIFQDQAMTKFMGFRLVLKIFVTE